MAMGFPLPSGAMCLAAASAILAPLAASGGLWVARATDPALARISAGLRPSSIALASGLALGIAAAASATTLAGVLVCACLAGSAAADRDQLVLPDILTLAAVALGLAFRPFASTSSRLELLGAGAGLYALFFAFALAMRAWRGRGAFGQGDVKLIAAIGVILPASLMAPAVLAGALSALASVCLPARSARPVIALGLHLVIGSAVALGAASAFPSLLGR
jgi:prepilin signal peptidase PulO-like enzyme (type II secretory pathway)